jgi:signal transduction histidine kinase
VRLLPRSLFGRLMLVLASGLIIAQLLSATINLVERDSALVRASGMTPAQRIADVVKLLDSLGPSERSRIVGILQTPPLMVSLERAPMAEDAPSTGGAHAAMFTAVLRAALGDERPVRVAITGTPPDWTPGRAAMGGAGPIDGRMGAGGIRRFPPSGIAILAQVRLQDGSWATFDTRVSQESASLPWRLLGTLLFLLGTVLVLSYVAVRWATRPLNTLAKAADELGRDIHRPPLKEDGPIEVHRAAHAFNTMQARLIGVIEERTRLLTAMSHDLKTPLTRMRLRTELLEDEALREKFERDLVEMEVMVTRTLEFMRGLHRGETEQKVDVMALLESLQADNEAMGRIVAIEGRITKPFIGVPQLLKRCIANLVDNATQYGGRADIKIVESPGDLTILIRDRGPGIPEDALETVFEPFYRLEASRSRETGGTGLGLSIARNIARSHGGDVRLVNHPEGGLEAILSLPWKQAPDADP